MWLSKYMQNKWTENNNKDNKNENFIKTSNDKPCWNRNMFRNIDVINKDMIVTKLDDEKKSAFNLLLLFSRLKVNCPLHYCHRALTICQMCC